MKADAAVGVAALGSVFQVTLDGTAYLGKLAANLMVTTCLQIDLQQTVAVAPPNQAVTEFCAFAVGHFALVSVGFVLLLVADQPMNQGAGGLWRRCSRDGPVGLADFARGEHFVEPRQCFAGTGKEHDATDRTVEPVNHTKEDVAWFGIRFLDVLLHCLAQRCVAGLVALNDFTTLLRDDDKVVVFVKNGHFLHIHSTVDLDDLSADIA